MNSRSADEGKGHEMYVNFFNAKAQRGKDSKGEKEKGFVFSFLFAFAFFALFALDFVEVKV